MDEQQETAAEAAEDNDRTHLVTVDADFPGRLRRLRLQRSLSQRRLALPGVSYAYISRLESGTRMPSGKVIRGLAGRLGVTENYLAFGEESGGVLSEHEAWVLAYFGDISDQEFAFLKTALDALRAVGPARSADWQTRVEADLSLLDNFRLALEELHEADRLFLEAAADSQAVLAEFQEAREARSDAAERLRQALNQLPGT